MKEVGKDPRLRLLLRPKDVFSWDRKVLGDVCLSYSHILALEVMFRRRVGEGNNHDEFTVFGLW